MKKRDVERTQLVTIQKDLSDAPAILVTMETDTTAQVSQCFIPFSPQGPYKVSHSSDQAIHWKRRKALITTIFPLKL